MRHLKNGFALLGVLIALGSMSAWGGQTTMSFSYTGPAVAIPDAADLSGTLPGAAVTAPLVVSGLTGKITKVVFKFDGTPSAVAGDTGVGLDHSFINDLQISLISPASTTVLMIKNTDGGGNNFAQTVLDDAASVSIQDVATNDAPFVGTYTPFEALSKFNGETANGTWLLQAQDFFSQDTGNIRLFTITITTVDNLPPVITSGIVTNVNPGLVGFPVNFSAPATDPDNDPLTYAWDFGDGGMSALKTPSHVYTAVGTYTVTVTVSDGKGGTAMATLQEVINKVGEGDADGDGFSDEIEAALGSSPTSAASTPLGLESPVATGVFTVPKLTIALNFATPKSDSLSLTGHIPVNGVIPTGDAIIIDVGGVVRSFILDKSGTGKIKNSSDKVTMHIRSSIQQPSPTTPNFRLKLSGGSFAAALADEGLTSAPAVKAPKTVNVTIIFLNTTITATVGQLYTVRGTQGRTTTEKQ